MATTSIYVNALRLTPEGEQAIANANSGGIIIRPVGFKAGDYIGQNPNDVPTTLLGNELASGDLSFVQILTENSARFVFDIKVDYVAGEAMKSVGELLILLEDNRTFGHVVLRDPIIAVPNSLNRISLLVHVQQDIQKIIDVTLYDYSTIPSVAKLEALPSSNDNQFNAVSVLDLHTNSDNTGSPGVAYRYGPGGYNWGFSEHDRVWAKQLGTSFINANTFKITDLVLNSAEIVILQVISGPGAGACRHYKMLGGQLVNQGQVIPFISASSTVAIWRRITNPLMPTTGIPWPLNNEVPKEWVLCRGEDDKPYWSSVSGGNRQTTATLFTPPGKLIFSSITTTAYPDQLSYPMGQDIASSADVLCITSGVMQSRTSYITRGQSLDLGGNVPSQMTLDLRMFRTEPTQGHVLNMEIVEATGDGQTSVFSLGTAVDSADQVFAIVGNVWQPVTSYAIQNSIRLAFTDSIPSGNKVSLYCARYEERAGWTSRIRVAHFETTMPQSEFILPLTPLSKAYVVMNVGGLAVHGTDFTLVNNVVRTLSSVPADTTVEFTIFENVKSVGSQDTSIEGVIVDVLPTPDGYSFSRQGMSPLIVPMFKPDVIAGKGISIAGKWPAITINTDAALAAEADPKAIYNIQDTNDDVEEIVVVQRIDFKKAIVVTCSADFIAELGPGFAVLSGNEHVEFVLSTRGPGYIETEYGRGVKGSGKAGFNFLTSTNETVAYSNASINQLYELLIENHAAGYVDVVAKMRVVGANVTGYGAKLTANLCIKVEPR
ncbi:hypothetical protein fHeYen902_334c [Yersinia phage fHe-Yen9-02]|nr:hypothetical protein fHeYen902_334c [Yersinia phage fHe-Yen9-02]